MIAPVPLDPGAHDRSGFSCGQPSMDRWLREQAGQAQRRDSARTYVVVDEARVVAYYSLCAHSLEPDLAPGDARFGQQRVPAVLLARLAVDESMAGRGLGSALLLDALVVSSRVADAVGARLLLVHALNETAARFYARHGFTRLETDRLVLYVRMDSVRRTLRRAGLA